MEEKFYAIGKTAKAAGMTAETLRHYDRIGLARPSRTDEETGYRYYTERDIVRLNIVGTLKSLDLPLLEIKRVLELEGIDKIAEFLKETERRAEDKIAEWIERKERIGRAKAFYESKSAQTSNGGGIALKSLPKRVVLLSKRLSAPTAENLWSYQRHFYEQIGAERKEAFSFEDTAGIWEENGRARLFAVCEKYEPSVDVRILPERKYLCADCTEATRGRVTSELIERAKSYDFNSSRPIVTKIVLNGIMRWNYEIQILAESSVSGI